MSVAEKKVAVKKPKKVAAKKVPAKKKVEVELEEVKEEEVDEGLVVYEFRNEKQNQFFDMVMKAVARVKGFEYRYFFYGGAIRGGKTFVCLYIFVRLCRLFPNSRWYVIREDNPALESTSIPSMKKLIGETGSYFKWKMAKGNVYVQFDNGSIIFFKSENLQRDKELKEFLGMEMNGCLLEQMEALSETLQGRVMERLGSWYIDPMPIPLLLGTFNPSAGWIKKAIYDKFLKGELKKPYFYQPALPNDNPFVTPEQWENWDNLDPESRRIMIEGVWSFKVNGNVWAYAFSEERHVLKRTDKRVQVDKRLPLYFIFDFNVDPITCLVAQRNGMESGVILREYRLRNSDIYELIERINIDYPETEFFRVVTGDASGRNRSASNKGAKSYVDIIRIEMRLGARQVQFPSSNPSIRNTRILANSLFHRHPAIFISEECLFLIDDLNTVITDENGDIDKKKLDPLKTHLLDNLRYFFWNYFKSFVKF